MFFEYDRMAAVEYARKWALGRNPKFRDYEEWGGNCTNFISQCINAGGIPMDPYGNGIGMETIIEHLVGQEPNHFLSILQIIIMMIQITLVYMLKKLIIMN